MGLRIWNLLADLYDHAQLADNWTKVDYHDHSPGRGVLIPTAGIEDGAITAPKIATALDPSGAYTSFKTQLRIGGTTPAAAAAGTYSLRQDFGALVVLPVAAANSAIYLDPDDWVGASRLLKYRLRATAITNAVAPTASYALSLNPVATWGGVSGTGATIATIGSIVAGSTLTFTTPAASGPTAVQVAEFDPPVAGFYTLSVVQTGAAAAGSLVTFIATVSAHQV